MLFSLLLSGIAGAIIGNKKTMYFSFITTAIIWAVILCILGY
jgi:hypothetical protein